ncbi:hypothetical protein N8I71_03765 [Roseibacterium sp. SDUM158016]|uniref:hypothetical protein n=1 Tax=Roseicyclus sediminis TaxID=2980997 RepID=UPI0021D34F56|nr:hypothetical protein [Roseibacterium sp. SDUM158016]MCU4651931.1 hypothetical protein [Roseibacterium sp. SDUM158016]
MSCHIVVHARSLPFIRRNVEFLVDELARHHGGAHLLTVEATLDEARIPAPSIVYVIGEGLPPFMRRPGLFYVYVNFSVVAFIGNPLLLSPRGARLILRKRRLMAQKLPLADVLLDYYPAQTRVLQRRLAKPVLGFLPCSKGSQEADLPMAARDFDLCFVGAISPRRQRVLEAAQAAGLRLSPHDGADLEDLTARSRLTLNLHMQASNHLEIPRIVGSLSTATPVITERSFGLAEMFGGRVGTVQEARIGALVPLAERLLADMSGLEALRAEARQAFDGYRRRASAMLAEAATEIGARARAD